MISTKTSLDLQPLMLENHCIERVDCYKVVGVTISKDLSLNEPIANIMKKANTKLYFLKLF